MSGFRRILCGTDLSDASDSAILAAHREARLHGAELILVHVLPATARGTPMFPELVENSLLAREEATSRVLDAMLERVGRLTGRDAGTVSMVVDDGSADEALLRNAEQKQADLIVVGAVGASGKPHRYFGGTAAQVVKGAQTSVLVARSRSETGRILLAIDFSESSEEAARAAAQEAQQRCAQIIAAHCLEVLDPELALSEPGIFVPVDPLPVEELRDMARVHLAELLAPLDVHPEIEVLDGPPARTLVEAAKEKEVDLIVVGTSNRTGIDRLLLGSIAMKIVREAPCSVLVARPNLQARRANTARSAVPAHR